MSLDDKYAVIYDSDYWGKYGAPHAIMHQLRGENPIAWYDLGPFQPAWILTRHKDVEYVGKNPQLFLSAPRTVIQNDQGNQDMISLPQMDAPEHPKHRRFMQSWLTPKTIQQLEGRMTEIAKEVVDELAAKSSCEFCYEVAAQLPLRMICEMLGLGKNDEDFVLKLSHTILAAESGDTQEDLAANMEEAFGFCMNLVMSRREKRSDDFTSVIANAEIDGELVDEVVAASHLIVLISAGHDTTSSAISGGMLALINNSAQLAKLKGDPSLIDSAMNEMMRFVSPTTNFVRTASEDTEIDGVKIRKGEDVCLHYAAANRDPSAFENPDEFVIDRSPNRHQSFGVGMHACLGQMLARIEMRAIFKELVSRLEHIELDGAPEINKAFWVSGLKSLPVKYSIT